VVRDKADNCIIVCSIENFDPMGVHTGDSITVAPAQTLTDKEYQLLRNASIAILREIGVDTGGSNVQFGINAQTGRVVTFEYTLVQDFNDRPQHADALIRLLRHMPCKVNLIPLSPVDGFDGKRPDDRVCLAFLDTLLKAKINTTLRKSRGKDVDAACGQLRLRKMNGRSPLNTDLL